MATYKNLVTDWGSSFHNKLSPHHPEGDGKYERMNQTIIKSLRLVCNNQTEWADKLPSVLMSYRASVATPLGVSPHFALYGRQMNVSIDITLMTDMETAPGVQRYTAELIPKLKIVQQAVQENLTDSNVACKTCMIGNLKNLI